MNMILGAADCQRGCAQFPRDSAHISMEPLAKLVAGDMALVNKTILSRTSSDVSMIPEVANHLISSGGKRLRPILTLATAGLSGYRGEDVRAALDALRGERIKEIAS